MGITVLARALVAPPLRIVRHGMRSAAAANSGIGLFSMAGAAIRASSAKLAIYLADSLSNARPATAATLLSTDPPVMGEGIHTSSPGARHAAPPRQEGAAYSY